MVFSSLIFLCIFLPVMIIGYYLLPKKLKNIFLVIGSLIFYAWGEPKYIFIMLSSIIGNYLFGMFIYASANKGTEAIKKLVLVLSVFFNLGILIYFKYFVLIITTIDNIFSSNLTIPEIALPIGISFYTFQGMSYVIDVYRCEGKIKEDGTKDTLVQKNFINLALYISMFPQLIAGPIVRYTDIKDSLKNRNTNLDNFSKGTERFIVGLAKKVMLANTIGEIADKIFTSDLSYVGSSVAWLGAICYTLQIFYDFSGYSDMAIGLGKIFGFDFMENFNYPYISRSITEFWRRWHISLSTWFRDYLYIPLGGNRKGNVYVNLFIVFLATGIWHGAAWGFLLWGVWHGIFMLIERVLRKRNISIKLPGIIKWLYTMLVVVLGWVLFKLEELPLALSYIGVMFHMNTSDYTAFSMRYYMDNKMIFLMIMAVIVAIPWAQVLPRRISNIISSVTLAESDSFICIIRRIVLVLLLGLSMMFIVNSTYNPFIYFRF